MWHEALFLVPEHALRPDVDTYMNVPSTLTTNMLNNQLGSNPNGVTVFSRNGMTHKDGSPIAITTHQFRHLLNTLAQSKHLSESLIAFWSGRKHITQNAWYDHLPQEAFIEAYTKLGEHAPELSVQGPIADKARAIAENNGLTQSQALKIELGAIHSTRYGICRHDYALTPCPKDKDCTMCGEHAVVKGSRNIWPRRDIRRRYMRRPSRRPSKPWRTGSLEHPLDQTQRRSPATLEACS